MVKLYDLHAAARQGIVPSLRAFAGYLPNELWLVLRRKPAETSWTTRRNMAAFIRRTFAFAIGCAASQFVWRINWSVHSFAAEHVVKAITFYIALITGAGALAAAWRLAGGVALDPFHHPAAASTPAEFWRRWNRAAAQWFHEYVFCPAGGAAAPIRATVATFLVSALLHEYLFTIVVGRVQGFQMAFFMVQGAASIATFRLRPSGWLRPASVAMTFVFSLATSVLFFASLNHALGFYSRPLPGWIGRWDRLGS